MEEGQHLGILKMNPVFKEYMWGGHKLVDEYHKAYDGEVLAESWELSCHPDGESVIANGPDAGKTLGQYIEDYGRQVLGTNCGRFQKFPILIKFIDAKHNLSIQVHPNDQFALEYEGQSGKSEMWYVVDAGSDSFIYYGFERVVSKEEFAQRIEDGTILEVLHKTKVQKGDVFFIEAGTIHAVGKGILLAEIQQNSNVTYRVWDYGRKEKGKKRELHIEKALAVTKRLPAQRSRLFYPHVADCDCFTVDRLNMDGKMMCRMEGKVTQESFVSFLFLDGQGWMICPEDGSMEPYRKGDSLFLPAGIGKYVIEGSCDALVTTIRKNTVKIRTGGQTKITGTKVS